MNELLRGFWPFLPASPRMALRLSWAIILLPLRGERIWAVFMPLGGSKAHGDTTEIVTFYKACMN